MKSFLGNFYRQLAIFFLVTLRATGDPLTLEAALQMPITVLTFILAVWGRDKLFGMQNCAEKKLRFEVDAIIKFKS